MPTFTRVLDDNSITQFGHPCFAWAGYSDFKGTVKAYRIHFAHTISLDDAMLILNAIKQSGYINVLGTDIRLYLDAAGRPKSIEVDIDPDAPGYVVFTTLKLIGKVFSYSKACQDLMLTALKAGLNFSQASVYARSPQAYRYPFVTYSSRDAEWLYRYLIKEEINWESLKYWAENGWGGKTVTGPYKSASFGPTCPDNPLGYQERNPNDRTKRIPTETLEGFIKFIEDVRAGEGSYGK